MHQEVGKIFKVRYKAFCFNLLLFFSLILNSLDTTYDSTTKKFKEEI